MLMNVLTEIDKQECVVFCLYALVLACLISECVGHNSVCVVSICGGLVRCSPALLFQDAPLSDCTDSIDGIDPSESFSPSRSIRKVHPAITSNHTQFQYSVALHPEKDNNIQVILCYKSVCTDEFKTSVKCLLRLIMAD